MKMAMCKKSACQITCVVCLSCVQLKARDVSAQALGFVQCLVAALLNFHSYTEQRVHIYPLDSSIESITPVNQRVRAKPSCAFCFPMM